MSHTRGDWTCPFCRRPNDCTAGDGRPQPGDVLICYGCGGVHLLGDDGQPRRPTRAELDEISSNPIVRELLIMLSTDPRAALNWPG